MTRTNMKKLGRVPSRPALCLITLVAGLGLLLVSVPDADAQRSRSRPKAAKFSANKDFGLGLMLGAPSGLSGKYYLSADTAFDFGVGAIGYYGRRSGLHLHADFLWHPAVLATTDPFVLPFYFGVGGRLWTFRDRDDRFRDDVALGARVPIGLLMDFNNVPIDIFFELALVLDFWLDYGGAHVHFNGAIGARYYF